MHREEAWPRAKIRTVNYCRISKSCGQLMRELVSKARIGFALPIPWLLTLDVGVNRDEMRLSWLV